MGFAARCAARFDALPAATSVAVVDVYDLFVQALSILGSARMPTPARVRSVCQQLLFPSPTAVYATVPDIPDELLPTDESAWAQGWRTRDEQFAEVAAAYTDDGDPATAISRGELLVSEPRATSLRRVATSTVADAYWALATHDAPVVLLSDRWDAVALQWHLRSLGIDTPGRLVRLGTRPMTIEDGPDAHVLLTDELLAELVEAPRAWGRRRRLELARIAVDGPPRRWQLVELEPERDLAVLAPLDDDGTGPDALHLVSDERLGQELELDHLGLRLADATTVVPRLTSEPTPWPETSAAAVVGRFVRTRIRLAHTEDGLTYLGPEPATDDEPGPPSPTRVAAARILRAGSPALGRIEETAEDSSVHPLPGVSLRVGDVVLVVPFDDRTWIAISTHADHLGA
jgi:hypothetical protein